jgi:hemolysin activation/secretion protein
LRGKARFAALNLTYPLIRRSDLAMDAGVSLDGVNSDNALFGNILTTERSRAIRLVTGLAASRGSTDLKSALVISKGVSLFDAQAPGNERDFLKFNVAAQWEQRLTQHLLARLNLLGQHSADRLPGTELFALGGPTLGRGFDTAFVSVDRALGGVAELAYRPVPTGKFETSELYIFADGARAGIHRRAESPARSFGLASAGAGARLRYQDRVELGVEGATVLDKPAFYRRSSRLSFYFAILF